MMLRILKSLFPHPPWVRGWRSMTFQIKLCYEIYQWLLKCSKFCSLIDFQSLNRHWSVLINNFLWWPCENCTICKTNSFFFFAIFVALLQNFVITVNFVTEFNPGNIPNICSLSYSSRKEIKSFNNFILHYILGSNQSINNQPVALHCFQIFPSAQQWHFLQWFHLTHLPAYWQPHQQQVQ